MNVKNKREVYKMNSQDKKVARENARMTKEGWAIMSKKKMYILPYQERVAILHLISDRLDRPISDINYSNTLRTIKGQY